MGWSTISFKVCNVFYTMQVFKYAKFQEQKKGKSIKMREETTSRGKTEQLWVNCNAKFPEKVGGYHLSHVQVQL